MQARCSQESGFGTAHELRIVVTKILKTNLKKSYFMEHVKRTHGQSQKEVGSRVGSGGEWGKEGVVGGKWRQPYLNNKKCLKK